MNDSVFEEWEKIKLSYPETSSYLMWMPRAKQWRFHLSMGNHDGEFYGDADTPIEALLKCREKVKSLKMK